MDNVLTPSPKGQFAPLLHDGSVVAQIFVPNEPAVAGLFSLFWLGQASRQGVLSLIERICRVDVDELDMQLIGSLDVSKLSVVRATDASYSATKTKSLADQLISSAELPGSVGLNVHCTILPDKRPLRFYIWTTMADSTIENGYPEVGVEARLLDWNDTFFTGIVHPLLEQTIRKSGIPGLWKQASDTAAKLM